MAVWHGPTDREERQALWHGYRGLQDSAKREELIRSYDSYARMLAARYYAQRLRDAIPFEEYLQFARIGLIEAVDRFDPDQGVLFETFAGKRIKGAIVDGIATMSEVQQQLAERRQRMHERGASLADATDMTADDGPEQLFARLADIAIGLAIGFAIESDGTSSDGQAAYGDTTYAGVELKQLRELVLCAVRELPERERHVIASHYLQQRSFTEVARELGVTSGRVSQLHREGIERLRIRMKRKAGLDLQC